MANNTRLPAMHLGILLAAIAFFPAGIFISYAKGKLTFLQAAIAVVALVAISFLLMLSDNPLWMVLGLGNVLGFVFLLGLLVEHDSGAGASAASKSMAFFLLLLILSIAVLQLFLGLPNPVLAFGNIFRVVVGHNYFYLFMATYAAWLISVGYLYIVKHRARYPVTH